MIVLNIIIVQDVHRAHLMRQAMLVSSVQGEKDKRLNFFENLNSRLCYMHENKSNGILLIF